MFIRRQRGNIYSIESKLKKREEFRRWIKKKIDKNEYFFKGNKINIISVFALLSPAINALQFVGQVMFHSYKKQKIETKVRGKIKE